MCNTNKKGNMYRLWYSDNREADRKDYLDCGNGLI